MDETGIKLWHDDKDFLDTLDELIWFDQRLLEKVLPAVDEHNHAERTLKFHYSVLWNRRFDD